LGVAFCDMDLSTIFGVDVAGVRIEYQRQTNVLL
jgi:hypothetical protein